jgi:hypothetical protein
MAISTAFKTYIKTALAGNIIDVELTDGDIQFAFDQAKDIFIQRGNNNLDRKFYALSVITDQTTYTIPSNENIDTIVRVIKPRNGLGNDAPFSVGIIQSIFGSMYTGIHSGQSALATYELSQQMLESFDIYMANNIQFVWQKRNNSLMFLDPPKVDGIWVLESYADLTDIEYESLIWIKQFSIAEAKIILGRAYRKFSTVTTPSGEISLDGGELISDGKEERQILIDNIAEYVDGAPAGGVILIG